MKTFKTLLEVYEAAKPHQVTGQELINGRTRIGGEWQAFSISEELREQVARKMADSIGGRNIERIYNLLKHGRPQHWAIRRFVVSDYRKSPTGKVVLEYIAGQDQAYENKATRKELLSL